MSHKTLLCIVLSNLFLVLTANDQAWEISGAQSFLREAHLQASMLFKQLYSNISHKYISEIQGNSDIEIRKEFLKAHKNIVDLEGAIQSIPTHVGNSLIWVDRKRGDNYEPRFATDNYLSGPNKDVILFNQEYVGNATDLSLPDRGGIGFAFRRYYYSNLIYAGPIGNGWDFNYNSRIICNPSSSMATLYVNGLAYQFKKIAGQWKSNAGNFFLLKEENGRLLVYDSQLSRMEFEKSSEKANSYRLVALASRHVDYTVNRLLILYREKSDRINYILDPYGNKILFSYNNLGQIIQISTAKISVNYNYDLNGNLVEVKTSPIANTLNSLTVWCVKYGYGKIKNHFMLSSKIVNNSPACYCIEYDKNGKLTRIGTKSPDVYAMWTIAAWGNKVKIQPAQPAPAIEYTFSSNTCRDLPETISIPALKSLTRLKYNSAGLLLSSLDSLGIRKEYCYDEKNSIPYLRMNLMSVTTWPIVNRKNQTAEHLVDTFTYATNTAFVLQKKSFEFNKVGESHLLSKQLFTYTKDWNIAIENINGIIKRYFYNQYGNMVIAIDANNRATVKFYDDKWPIVDEIYSFNAGSIHGKGLCVKIISDISKRELDGICDSLGIDNFYFNAILRVQPISRVTQFCYDSMGNISALREGKKIKYFVRNRLGNILASYISGKGKSITNYNKNLLCKSVLHQFVPQAHSAFQGATNSIFSGKFFKESFEYDSAERVISHSMTDELFEGKKVKFSYNRYPNGKLQQITSPVGLIRYDKYSNTGLLFSQTLYGVKSSVVISSDYEYFPDGSIKKYRNALGDLIQNKYDSYGRKAIVKLADGTSQYHKFDGQGRILIEAVIAKGKEISRTEYQYGSNGKIDKIYDFIFTPIEQKKLLKKQYVYDKAGNVVAQRDIQNDSWRYFLLDGLNRTVGIKNATGDILVSVYDSNYLRFTHELNPVSQDKFRDTGTLYLRDQLGFPAVVIPVGSNKHPMEDRGVINKYNCIGQLCSIKQFNQCEIKKLYNTLGNIYQESTIPLHGISGELPLNTYYRFNAGGQLIKKIVNNNALAMFSPKENASVKLISAPQTTTYSYDSLSRQCEIQQPDGLIIRKIYDARSLPIEMIWSHASHPHQKLRHLQLKYGVLARLKSISDGIAKTTLRKYSYDDLGNCIVDEDYSAAEAVATHRSFDSLGHLLSEYCTVGNVKLPGLSISYDLPRGNKRIKFDNMPALSIANWRSQTIHQDCLGRTISISLDDSKSSFAKWDYCGKWPISRKIPESLITVRNTYSSQNDLIKTDFFEKSNQLGSLKYKYDEKGNNIFLATSLAENSITPYTFAQYMGYNDFRQLVEENGEPLVYSDDKILLRRNQLFAGNNSLQATKTIRRVYDQADNTWALYRGNKVKIFQPKSFKKNNLMQFISPANILDDVSFVSNNSLLELSSNRDTTQAHFDTDGKLTAEINSYDNLGNLKEFTGEFWNGKRSIQVHWKLEFDTMGRLSQMRGYANNDSIIKKGYLCAELNFLYDSNNRRIKKSVKDFSRGFKIERHEFTIYHGYNQALILKENLGKMSLFAQYLWNNDTRELLMGALQENGAENTDSAKFYRYFFQQDRGLNTICVTKNVNGKVLIVSGASYLGFGKNATSAPIMSINSSMNVIGKDNFAAYNRKLDDNLFSKWQSHCSTPQYLEINLAKNSNLTSAKIWTNEKFPHNFMVFVLPIGADSPHASSNLITWSQYAIEKGYFVYQQKDSTTIKSDKPINIPLFNVEGNRIVLLWDQYNESEIAVREIEITQMPKNPGAIAYAGQWFDCETNMYYQINRYKLAGSSKFISPDPIGFLDGNNLYAYAKNNPLEWHDPNGEWAHILLGAAAGAVINSGVYALQCWWMGAEFSWKELAIRAGTGALAGGIAAATFGIVNPFLAGIGMNATANIVISATTAGFAGGFASGTTDTLMHGGKMTDALMNGLASGGWGAVGGAVSGGVLSYTGASLGGAILSGMAGGGTVGGIQSAWNAYDQTGDWSDTGWAALDGAIKGGSIGAVVGGASWGIGRVTEKIVPLQGYPKHMTDPRSKGILIKTKSGERTYGGMPAKPGYQRQHIKPLSLGGRDVPSNIEYMRTELHSTNPALGGGPRNVHPGAYVNSKPLGTIFY